MTDEERKHRAYSLKNAIESEGGKILMEHIDGEIKDGWEAFISLPVLQKTSKMALNHQARYDVLKGLKDWVESEIRVADLD